MGQRILSLPLCPLLTVMSELVIRCRKRHHTMPNAGHGELISCTDRRTPRASLTGISANRVVCFQ